MGKFDDEAVPQLTRADAERWWKTRTFDQKRQIIAAHCPAPGAAPIELRCPHCNSPARRIEWCFDYRTPHICPTEHLDHQRPDLYCGKCGGWIIDIYEGDDEDHEPVMRCANEHIHRAEAPTHAALQQISDIVNHADTTDQESMIYNIAELAMEAEAALRVASRASSPPAPTPTDDPKCNCCRVVPVRVEGLLCPNCFMGNSLLAQSVTTNTTSPPGPTREAQTEGRLLTLWMKLRKQYGIMEFPESGWETWEEIDGLIRTLDQG